MSDGLPSVRACLAETRALRRAHAAAAPRSPSRPVRLPGPRALVAVGGLLAVVGLPPTAQALMAAPAVLGDVRSVQAGQNGEDGRSGAERSMSGPPVRLRVERVAIDVPVVGLGLRADGGMVVPRRADTAAWFDRGPLPGQPGAALVVAHFDSSDGPAAFYHLRDVRAGDRVTVQDERGGSVLFVVDRISEHRKSAFPTEQVFGGVTRPELRLITCSGSFNRLTRHYSHNLVVYAHLAEDGGV